MTALKRSLVGLPCIPRFMEASVTCTQKYILYAIYGSFLCQASEHWLVWLCLALYNKGLKAH